MGTGHRFAIHSPNWLGDVVMFLPAWRAWRDAHRDARVAIVAKRRVAGLWKLIRDVDDLVVVEDGRPGTRQAVAALRGFAPFDAIAVPLSFRSAWLLRRGGAASIRGVPAQFRSFLLADRVSITDLAAAHQQFEYARIMGVDGDALPPPSAAVDAARLPPCAFAGVGEGTLAVLPGAARGASKRWPPEFFAEAARRALDAGLAANVAVCGTPGEAAECEAVASALGAARCVNLCGRTGLGELASLLSRCRAALSNDSGGMHIAALAGTPVVAVFGLTDPAKTGPLGTAVAVAAEGVRHARAIPRESAEAERALRSVTPSRVFEALKGLVARK